MKLINVLFIDYMSILDVNGNILTSALIALKNLIIAFDNFKIICINNKNEIKNFNYNEKIDQLSQFLDINKLTFFDKLNIDDSNDIGCEITKWMKNKEIKSFAIVSINKNNDLAKTYPNNTLYCKNNEFSESHVKEIYWIMSNYKNNISNDNNVFFCSDTHFGHRNIIKYCNRPWNHGKDENGEIIATNEDVLAMDNEMIRRWNSVVGKNDIVWHLGDFSLGGKDVAQRVFPQLNGKINLIMGNHDHWKIDWYYDLGFNRVYDRKVIIHDFVILSHAPLMFLNENCPFYQIFGHVHSSNAYQTWSKNSCCVCVERHDYTPVSWKTIKQKYEELNEKC